MIVRLGYVAMSKRVKNASPSQTMTYTQFEKLHDREAGIRKLERIALSNLNNCLRLLKHNKGHDISFFRFSSKLIPLANHEELTDWKFMKVLRPTLAEIGEYIRANKMRVDFHPDHFVILNSTNQEILKTSVKTLRMHEALLKGMKIPPIHRCVLHVGGGYKDKERALEQFIENWSFIPTTIQQMVMLENDDKTFSIGDTLYLGEKLAVPVVFDYHHHLVNDEGCNWEDEWQRIVHTWKDSPLPIKMHISSPRDEKDSRAHADYIDKEMFLTFLHGIKGSVPQIDCMVEAKGKDDALFRLMNELSGVQGIENIDGASFYLK
jgi:UV DNA damage endonuclease